jgi:hypothetical protein
MNDKIQNQSGGENSQNIQGGPNGSITVNNGLTISDAKEIVLLLLEQDFARFSEKAVLVARERAEQMVDSFLQKIIEQNPALIQSVEDPGMQMALIKAQQEHVRTGDNDIRDILVKALVARAAMPERGILQISIDESLIAIGKLTMRQIDILTLCLFLHHTKASLASVNKDYLGGYLLKQSENILISLMDSIIERFLSKDPFNYSNYVHIASCSCGDIIMGSDHFVMHLLFNYPGLFCKGFTKSELSGISVDNIHYSTVFIPCLHNDSLWQVSFLDNEELITWVHNNNVDYDTRVKLTGLMRDKLFTENEMIEHVAGWGDNMVRLLKEWEGTSLKVLTLNNIGKAVAVMNYNRVYDIDRPLSMWIAE